MRIQEKYLVVRVPKSVRRVPADIMFQWALIGSAARSHVRLLVVTSWQKKGDKYYGKQLFRSLTHYYDYTHDFYDVQDIVVSSTDVIGFGGDPVEAMRTAMKDIEKEDLLNGSKNPSRYKRGVRGGLLTFRDFDHKLLQVYNPRTVTYTIFNSACLAIDKVRTREAVYTLHKLFLDLWEKDLLPTSQTITRKEANKLIEAAVDTLNLKGDTKDIKRRMLNYAKQHDKIISTGYIIAACVIYYNTFHNYMWNLEQYVTLDLGDITQEDFTQDEALRTLLGRLTYRILFKETTVCTNHRRLIV